MYLQEILEVVIGVIFTWMLLSIAVLQIQEIIASFLEKRSSDLEMVIRDMLNDKAKVKEFYNHPLIKSLSKPIKLSEKDERKAVELENKDVLTLQEKRMLSKLRQRPSYIPSSKFASALMDIVIDAGTEKSIILREVNSMRPIINELKAEDREKANAIVEVMCQLGKNAAKSKAGIESQNRVKTELKKQARKLGAISPNLESCTDQLITLIDSDQYDLGAIFESNLVLDQLRVGTQALIVENPTLSRSINSLLDGVEQYAVGADTALAVGRKNVEDWFDSTMDRLSGWYKRWAQVWAFFIGFAIALLFNVDSLYIAQVLWRNPATRLAAATYIENYVETNAKKNTPEDTVLNVVQSDIQKLNFPLGWKLGVAITGQEDNDKSAEENFIVAGQYSVTGNTNLITKVTELLPKEGSEKILFFTTPEMAGICVKNLDADGNVQPACYEVKDAPRNFAGVLAKLAGCLATALAALQGAPFWFDTLKKIVNVRSTGINPIEKPKESTGSAQ